MQKMLRLHLFHAYPVGGLIPVAQDQTAKQLTLRTRQSIFTPRPVVVQAFFAEASSSPLEALGTAGAGAFVGYLIADLFSGLLHWSLDNYGGRSTPVFGAIIDSFQGHHGETAGGVERLG